MSRRHQGTRVIRGFVEGVDELPYAADKLGFDERVAFAFDSYREGAVDLCFDYVLYVILLCSVASAVRADQFGVDTLAGDAARLTLEELVEQIEMTPEEEREPLGQIVALEQGIARAILVSEPWARIGGPEPYHDSYTVAVFSDQDSVLKIEQEMRAEYERIGAEVREIIVASRRPKHTIGSKIKRKIRRVFEK